MSNVKALILAAGMGSRLKHKTRNIPKALVPVAGKPILAYQIEALLKNQIYEIGIVTGYEGEKIISFINEEFPELDVRFFENTDFDVSNSSYSFWVAREFLKGSAYLHFNCDNLIDADLVRKLLSEPRENVICIHRGIPLQENMEQVSVASGKIIKMDNSRFEEAEAKAFGVAKFSPEAVHWVLQLLEGFVTAGDKKQNYYGLLHQAVSEISIHGLDATEALLLEVNTLDDLIAAEERLRQYVPKI